MKKLVTTKQLIFILIISLVTLKVLYLPSLLVEEIGRDCYIFFFLMLLLDFFVLCIFLYLYNKFPELTFYQILQKLFGTFVAKTIMLLLGVFFLAKCWAVFQSNYIYLNENLHNTIKWYVFSIPILIVVFYMSTFGMNAFSRLVEIMFPVIFAGFMLAFFTGLFRADFSNLLPVCENGFFSYVPTSLKFSFWFGDYLIFTLFFGKVKRDKKFNLKVLISVGIAIVFITFFLAIVYSVFSYGTVCHTNSISDIMQVLPSSSDIGGFDWVIILIWDAALFLYFTLNVLASLYCIKEIVPKFNEKILVCFLLVLVVGSNFLTHFDIIHNVEIVENYVVYFSAVVQYGLPIIILIFVLFRNLKVFSNSKKKNKTEAFRINSIKLRPQKNKTSNSLNIQQKYFCDCENSANSNSKNKNETKTSKDKENICPQKLNSPQNITCKKFTFKKKEQKC